MLPIRDDNPTRTTPLVTWLIVAACVFVYFALQPHTPDKEVEFLYERAAIPCEIVTAQPLTLQEIRSDTCSRAAGQPVFPAKNIFTAVLASIFFHGSFLHLAGNMWVLWIFGNNIEDTFGHVRYLVFYLVAGIIATAGHVAMTPSSTAPVVGASGAIAGVMGAYLVLHPRARVTSIVPPLFFLPFRVPAAVFLVVWFVGQFFVGDTSVAWMAHVAGFVVGALYAVAFNRRRPGRRSTGRPE
jgi:membrane associated rhomboid family serine protease